METTYFNIWPNIWKEILINNLLYFWFLILIFFSAVLFFIFLSKIVIYLVKKHKSKIFIETINKDILNYQKKKLLSLKWNEFIKKSIEFIETVKIKWSYKNIDDVLLLITDNKEKIEEIKKCIYKEKELNNSIEKFLKSKIKKLDL